MRPKFFLEGLKAQLDENGRRILLGDDAGGGVACCGRSGCSVLEFGFQLGSLVFVDHIQSMFNSILRNSNCSLPYGV
jgi:hypothetical protein